MVKHFFFLPGILKPEKAYATRKDVGVNMVMPFINHENHIKTRASLTPSVTRSMQGLGVFCTLFRIKEQMMFDTLPSPQEKKENTPSTRQI